MDETKLLAQAIPEAQLVGLSGPGGFDKSEPSRTQYQSLYT